MFKTRFLVRAYRYTQTHVHTHLNNYTISLYKRISTLHSDKVSELYTTYIAFKNPIYITSSMDYFIVMAMTILSYYRCLLYRALNIYIFSFAAEFILSILIYVSRSKTCDETRRPLFSKHDLVLYFCFIFEIISSRFGFAI